MNKNILNDKYNLIILVLIVILAILFLYMSITQKDGFTTITSEDDIFGNLLYNCGENGVTCNRTKVFKKQYRITGFQVINSSDSKYKMQLNNSYISVNDNIELTNGVYYDISDLNIKSKSITIETLDGSDITEMKIYGLNDNNIMSKGNYDSVSPIFSFNINASDKIFRFENEYEHLINYIDLTHANTSNIEIKYKNQFTNSAFETYSSGILDLDNKYHKTSKKIYFNTPILASELNIIYTEDSSSALTDKNSIKVYGKIASENDIKTYKIESEIASEESAGVVLDGQKCPAMNDIISRQKLINDLCNSISEKDKIRNHQTNYEKTKKYIAKLKQQESHIQALKIKLNNLLKDNDNTALSFQEKTASIQELINDVNVKNPFNTIDINYTDTPVITQQQPTTTQPTTTQT